MKNGILTPPISEETDPNETISSKKSNSFPAIERYASRTERS